MVAACERRSWELCRLHVRAGGIDLVKQDSRLVGGCSGACVGPCVLSYRAFALDIALDASLEAP